MECLATGRAISLPSVAGAAAKLSARAASAYALVREQFDTPIGRFEGVEEPLARIAGLTYAIDAASRLTAAAIDAGERPAVLSAIVKAYCTEPMRDVVNDAMDIRAGAAVMRGPRNIIGPTYASIPIAITVEGANILTRSMIIYGQGGCAPTRSRSRRCAPWRPATSSVRPRVLRPSALRADHRGARVRAGPRRTAGSARAARARCAAHAPARTRVRGIRARLGGRHGDARRRAQAARGSRAASPTRSRGSTSALRCQTIPRRRRARARAAVRAVGGRARARPNRTRARGRAAQPAVAPGRVAGRPARVSARAHGARSRRRARRTGSGDLARRRSRARVAHCRDLHPARGRGRTRLPRGRAHRAKPALAVEAKLREWVRDRSLASRTTTSSRKPQRPPA